MSTQLTPVEAHLARCLALVGPLPPVEHALGDAHGCVLAGDVAAVGPLPAFDNSAMDGYAVRVEDVAAASEAEPVVLPVVADVAAAPGVPAALVPGTASRIMTGAPVPAGTGGVVPVEWTDGGAQRVAVRRAPAPGQHVRRAGEDVEPGEVLMRAGTRLTARHLSLLAALGHGRVRVHPRPRVVVVSTGSELVPPGAPVGPGQVVDANGVALVAAAREAGCEARHAGLVGDDEAAVLVALTQAAATGDVVVTSGGVSMGVYDTVKEVLGRLGTVTFDKVAMQPGMPQGAGTLAGPGGAVPVFTLPGNPVSAFVSFEVFVRPALRTLRGEAHVQRPVHTAVAAQAWRSPPGKRQYVRVATSLDDAGRLVVRPVGHQGSHLVADLAAADALAVVPEERAEVRVGDELLALLLQESS